MSDDLFDRMPAMPALLNQKQRDDLTTVITKKVTPRPCEFCGNAEWSLNEALATPAFLKMGERPDIFVQELGIVHPCAVLQCTNCGNTKLLSLRALQFDPWAPK